MSEGPLGDAGRRQFLATTAAAAAAVAIVPRHVLGGPRFVAPSDKVNVALVGVGGQGLVNARALFQEDDCQVIAVADPAEEWDLSAFYYGGKGGRSVARAEIEKTYAAKTPNHRCAVYDDFRVMLEKEKAVDAVLVATPEHLHGYCSIVSMKAGKHVYCEKPLANSVWEARQMARVAAETGVATQMGNQGRSSEGHRQIAEWIWDGAIGAVREVHAWNRAPASFGVIWRPAARPTGTYPVPAGLNFDLWLGPRKERPWHPAYAPVTWRGFWDFGGGAMPDMGIHHLDPAFNALDLAIPETVEATAYGEVDLELCSRGLYVTWRFAANDKRGPVTVHWYDGGLMPATPPEIDPEDPKQRLGEGEDGVFFVGEKGIITAAGWSGMPRLLPLELHRSYVRPAKTIPRVPGHHADWLRACKGGPPASGNFGYGARLTEFMILGNVALRAGKMLRWDSANMKATNAAQADAFLKLEHRKGWELPL
ncbi:MAG TPA: Gfo/Idh/MocA family oxidoreductase [Vicinamibacteria bacterium]|nr:Gfo/Idh/MocA family oxidoreductase [Vicinamibacteria bacterium]